ncbi:MAG: HAD family phosphatase [Marinagarivorans sp.]|nr:HAD family phosphatase [Marinagarivorans sp.]
MTMSTVAPTHCFHAIIFDHDGTLVDSEYIHCQSWNKVLALYGHSLKFEDYCAHYNGLPTQETATQLKQHYNLSESVDSLYQQKIDFLNYHLAEKPFPLLAQVKNTLLFLCKNNIPLAIASGANQHEVSHSLQHHKIASFFKAVCTKNDVANSKPAPDVYWLAAEKLNLAPEHCLAIEDSDTGYQSARRAGMHCLRLSATPSPEEFKDMKAICEQLELWLLSGQLKKLLNT